MKYDDNLDQLHRIQVRDRFHLVTEAIAEMRGRLASLVEQQKNLKSRLGSGRKSDSDAAQSPDQQPAQVSFQEPVQSQQPLQAATLPKVGLFQI